MKNTGKKIILFIMLFMFSFIYTVLIGSHLEKKEIVEDESVKATATDSETEQLPTTQDAVMTTESTVETTEITEATTAEMNINNQPEELNYYLSQGGIDYNTLESNGCRQIVVVDAALNEADISMYELGEENVWYNTGLNCHGYVGSNGVTDNPHELSNMTPIGFYSIGDAFYISEKPDTGLDCFMVTESTYWVDDPESEHYNQRVELPSGSSIEWESAEHMIDYPNQYAYGFVINFNMNPVVAGRGSAIFFHVGNTSTAGCVAVDMQSILDYLAELKSVDNPYILILE